MLKKGGIETIVLIVILVAIVMGLIATAVIPTSENVGDIATAGATKLDNIWPDDPVGP